MNHGTDNLPNRPLPFEALTTLIAVHSSCLVNHTAPNACQNIVWKGREGEYPDRNLHLSTPDSAFFDFSQRGFISRLTLLARSFCCNSHRNNTEIHAYFAYLWVAYYIIKLGPSHKWDETQLHWFRLRAQTELLSPGQRPPFLNSDQDLCLLDSLQRCADYLPESDRQKFAEGMRNMIVQGKAVTALNDKQLMKVDELLERLEISEEPAKIDQLLEKLKHNEEQEPSTDVESEAGESELEDTLVVEQIIRLPTEYPQEDRKQDFDDWMSKIVPPEKAITRLDDEQPAKVEELPGEVQHDEELGPRTDTESEAVEPKLGDTLNVDEIVRVSMECLPDEPSQILEDRTRITILEGGNMPVLECEQLAKIDEVPEGIQLDEQQRPGTGAESEGNVPKPKNNVDLNEVMKQPAECLSDNNKQDPKDGMPTKILEDETMALLECEQSVEIDEEPVNDEKQSITLNEQLMRFDEQLMKHEAQLMKFKKLLMETEERSAKADELLRELRRNEKTESPTKADGLLKQLQPDQTRESSLHTETQVDATSEQVSSGGELEQSTNVKLGTQEQRLQCDREREPSTDIELKADGPQVDRPKAHNPVADETEADQYVTISSEADASSIDDPEVHEPEENGSEPAWPEADQPKANGPKLDHFAMDKSEVDELESDRPEADGPEMDESEIDDLDTDESVTDDSDTDNSHSDDSNFNNPEVSNSNLNPSSTIHNNLPLQIPTPFIPPWYRSFWFRGSAV
ncbi:MAG: hypothetical protein Q9195_002474 [Heterodermia aff. obscurata]